MTTLLRVLCLGTAGLALAGALGAALPEPPLADQRSGAPRTLNTPRSFSAPENRQAWTNRARELRERVLVSCGLWPMPEKTPLNPRITGRIEREGYTIEKVALETSPGFFLGGNLYRPKGRGAGPFPAVLAPHGHWPGGRLENQPQASTPARCANFAMQGMVAFSYDMTGYNDTQFAGASGRSGHAFATDPACQLWNLSLMGLQTWNSIRALDFLASLPEVDPARIGCSGASGGGTQTFMLGAVDDRLAAQAPCVMVSHTMQGGCACENAPGLRLDDSNLDFAACAAPRPQLLVAAAGDWTRTTPEIEGPALEKVYRLLGAEDRFRHVRLDFGHNENQSTREQVYGWFGKWLRGQSNAAPVAERPFHSEKAGDARVFPEGKLPEGALTQAEWIARWTRAGEEARKALPPVNPPLLERYQSNWLPAWRHTLAVEWADQGLLVKPGQVTKSLEHTATDLVLGRPGRGDRVPVAHIKPRRDTARVIVVLAHPNGRSACRDAAGGPAGLAKALVSQGVPVLLLDLFETGAGAPAPGAPNHRDYFTNYYTTYNRTECQERVQDLATACSFARAHTRGRRVILCGAGRAGLWALLAAPAADAVAADCDGLDTSSDAALLARDLFVPGLRRIGGFQGAALLAATHPLLLHQAGGGFATDEIRQCYTRMHVPELLRIEPGRLDENSVAEWVLKLNQL